jgi:uncharacterized protein involved in exopolysaccharide biosynthesis
MSSETARSTIGDYFRVVGRWKRAALAVVLLVLVLTGVFTALSDEVYTAFATALPQVEDEGMGMMAGYTAPMGMMGMFPGIATPADVAISVLESRTVTGQVVDEVGLVPVPSGDPEYEQQRIRAINKLNKKLRVSMNEHGLIRIRVQDGERERVAAIVNTFLRKLNEANVEFSITQAGSTRKFVEERLTDSKAKLVEAQAALQDFQRENGTFHIDEQTRATVEVIASHQGTLESLRTKREALMRYRSDNSAEIEAIDSEISAIETRLKTFSATEPGLAPPVPGARSADAGVGVLLSLESIPALAAEEARLLLAVETQSQVYTMLAQQYEKARIDEARHAPTVRVVDWATPPLFPTRPRPKLYMGAGLLVGLLLAFSATLLLDNLAPAGADELARLKALVHRASGGFSARPRGAPAPARESTSRETSPV